MCQGQPESEARVVRAEVDTDIWEAEVGALANPAADLDDAEAEGVELEACSLG